ncbi:MAG: hypothetical protein ACRDYE_06565, partial [Acidimicrobiales bacterium]
MAIKGPVGRAAEAGGNEDLMGRTVALVDLRDDPGAPGWEGADGTAIVLEMALRKIEQAVRCGDRVCPFGTDRVAVAFGPDADAVSTKTLAERLARAVRPSAVADGETGGRLQPVSGADGGTTVPDISEVPCSATVTVDRMIWRDASPKSSVAGERATGVKSRIPNLPHRPAPGLRHRTVVRCSGRDFARYGTRHDDIVIGDRGTVLVVSPGRASGGTPGLSAMAA